ncbi:MAG: lipoprotein insertase outer membrane protein LolB [Pseudomonadota bacterium]
MDQIKRSACHIMLGLLSLLLSACASVPPNLPTSETSSAMPARQYADVIELAGRLSVQYQQNNQDQALHGNFNWSQDKNLTAITLLSPLGQTLARIEITPAQSTMLQAGKAPRRAANVDALALDTLGWPLPVSGLRQWLQGFAEDADGKPFLATPQNAVVTTKDGWHIRFVSWESGDGTVNRPKRIDLTRSTAQAGEVAMRFVIDQWQAR